MPPDIPALDLEQALSRHFGFPSFQPGQREVIEILLAGRSAAAVFPTGGGKSLCYQLPALELPGLTLVVSPLVALMKDQVDDLVGRGIAAQRLDSSIGLDEYRDTMARLREGTLRLLYVAPERFANERFRVHLEQLEVALFAVDEAHCISEWGHNFRPDYLKLVRFARECRAERVLALTATATDRVLEDICDSFGIAPADAVRTTFYRSNLSLLAAPVSAEERDLLLLERLKQRPLGSAIVYVTLQRTAEQVADFLSSAGLSARPYHAGMASERRVEVQDWFGAEANAIVVATIAFGMGIDKADIRYVYHYNLPKSLENYSQEIGRAGRDGAPATCEMLVSVDDSGVLENFVYGDTPSQQSIGALLDHVFGLGEDFDVSLSELASRFDIRVLVVRTLLTYLELDGHLEGGTPFYSKFRFVPLRGSAEILSGFEGERRQFLAGIFRRAEKARKWFSLDVDQAARELGTPRQRVVRALDYLADRGELELEAAGVRHRYRRLGERPDLEVLTESLAKRYAVREAAEIGRLRQVLELVTSSGCQASTLGAHFGEPLAEPCGHCSFCRSGGKPIVLPERSVPEVAEPLWRQALALRAEHPDLLGEARPLARFLCGIGSPRLSRARLTSHALFGALREVPFERVLERSRS